MALLHKCLMQKVVISESSYNETNTWTDVYSSLKWPEGTQIHGGCYRSGEYFVMIASSNSVDFISLGRVFYGKGKTLEEAEVNAGINFYNNYPFTKRKNHHG